MSKLDLVQLGSLPFKPTPLFTSFQTLGATTTLGAYPANLARPVATAGSGSANPVAVLDNTKIRATSILLMLAGTTAASKTIKFDITGFSQIEPNTGLYLRTKSFLGEAQTSAFDISTAIGEATAFICDQFTTKTFASSFVQYIEPADGLSGAVIIVDIRGFDYTMIRFAQGASGPATKVQAWYGVN